MIKHIRIIIIFCILSSFYGCFFTEPDAAYKILLTDLQKNNLKGKVKKIVNNNDKTTVIYNENGFYIEKSEQIGYYKETFEYNSNNLITKRTLTDKYDNLNNPITLTYRYKYDKYNKLESGTLEIDGIKSSATVCNTELDENICITKDQSTLKTKINEIFKYYDKGSLKSRLITYYTSDGSSIDFSYNYFYYETGLLNYFEQLNYKGVIVEKSVYNYNSNKQITEYSKKTYYTDASIKTSETNTFTYYVENDHLKTHINKKENVSTETVYDEYVFDNYGNWTSRIVYSKATGYVTQTREISYY